MVVNQVYIYGHELDEEEIKRKYPYSHKRVRKMLIRCKRYTVTFDALMAYRYRMQGYDVIRWGGIYKGVTVFVFRRMRISADDLPF